MWLSQESQDREIILNYPGMLSVITRVLNKRECDVSMKAELKEREIDWFEELALKMEEGTMNWEIQLAFGSWKR